MNIFDQFEVTEVETQAEDEPEFGSQWVDRATGIEYVWNGEYYAPSHNHDALSIHWEDAGGFDLVLKEKWDLKQRAKIAREELGFPPEEEVPVPPPQLPALVDEDGEVINQDWVDAHMGRESFVIDSEASADWFVSRVRELQDRCERIAEMAAAGITESLRHMAGMMFYYGPQLREYTEKQLSLTKKGTYRSKNVKYSQGAVFYRKVGGWVVSDRMELQKFIDSLQGREELYRAALERVQEHLREVVGTRDDIALANDINAILNKQSPVEQFPVRIQRHMDTRKILKMCEATGTAFPGCTFKETDELAVMQVGGKTAWSVNRVKAHLKGLKLDQYKQLTYDDDDVVEGEVNES